MYEVLDYDDWKLQTPEEAAGCTKPDSPICPMCDKETNTYYFDKYYEIIGCDECVYTKDAYEYEMEVLENV